MAQAYNKEAGNRLVTEVTTNLRQHIDMIGSDTPYQVRGDSLKRWWEVFGIDSANPKFKILDQSTVVQVESNALSGIRGARDLKRRLKRIAKGVNGNKYPMYAVLEV